jgi:eukaryotic-like serine/threonine-protein kinase
VPSASQGRTSYPSSQLEGDSSTPIGGEVDELSELKTLLLSDTPLPEAVSARARSPEPMLTQGTVISGRYCLIEELGKGGFGTVWKALDTVTDNRAVAIKFFTSIYQSDTPVLDEIRREASVALDLTHERIVRLHIFDLEMFEGRPLAYLVFELLRGPTLRQILQARGSLTLPEILGITEQICEGLEYLHSKHVIHCDLKPQNIMLCEPLGDLTLTTLRPETCQLKLTDLGIAHSLSRMMGHDEERQVVGTPAHVSPEQIQNRPLTPATDIYQLGCVLFLLITGRAPYHRGNILMQHLTAPPPHLSGVPNEVAEVVRRCLAKDPALRWQSATELIEALRKSINRKPDPASPRPWRPDPASPRSRPARGNGTAKSATTGPLPSKAPSVHVAPRRADKNDTQPVPPGKMIGALGMELRLISGGEFPMGGNGASSHRVQVQPFYLGRCPVTVHQYETFLTTASHRPPPRWEAQLRHPDWPVVGVSWQDANALCRLLSRLSRRPYRLPTELEWECAAQGGAVGKAPSGSSAALNQRAAGGARGARRELTWESAVAYLGPVGVGVANRFDVHDMVGLVQQWCLELHNHTAVTGPLPGCPTDRPGGEARVIRGGSWASSEEDLRCSTCAHIDPRARRFDVGLRMVCDCVDPCSLISAG